MNMMTENTIIGNTAPVTQATGEEALASPGASVSTFVKRLKENVKEAYNINYNENTGEITMWVGDYFVVLSPQLEKDGSLIYTPIQIIWYDNQLKPIAKLYISSTEIEFEDVYRTLTAKLRGVEEDPIVCSDEQVLFDYLNELAEEDDFIAFAEYEFKVWSGL